MRVKIAEIAELVDGTIVGSSDVKINKADCLKDAGPGSVSFLGNSRYESLLKATKATCVLIDQSMEVESDAVLIKVKNSSYAFSLVQCALNPDLNKRREGIHESAVIDNTVTLGKDVSIGACAVIEEGVSIGDGSIIYPNVTVCRNSQIGKNVIVHAGAVIGSDGFGYATIDGVHKKIPQLGIVVVEDDVEIGANVTIDRARFDKTIIGKGSKIDNLVQIAHNAILGENCIFVSQSGISGSSEVGNNVIVAGQVGIAGHLKLEDNVIVGAKSGVTKSLSAGKYWGVPAKPMTDELREKGALAKLPELLKKVKQLEKEIEELKNA